MKVLIVGLAISTIWLITSMTKTRKRIAYLRNKVAQMKINLIKLEKYGKETEKRKKGEG